MRPCLFQNRVPLAKKTTKLFKPLLKLLQSCIKQIIGLFFFFCSKQSVCLDGLFLVIDIVIHGLLLIGWDALIK